MSPNPARVPLGGTPESAADSVLLVVEENNDVNLKLESHTIVKENGESVAYLTFAKCK